jgi:sphinganine-1-phosphate aldolase
MKGEICHFILSNIIDKLAFKQLRRLPSVKAKIDRELNSTLADMEKSMMAKEVDIDANFSLPENGLTADQVRERLLR